MYLFEYIVNIFFRKFYKQAISVKRTALEDELEIFKKQAWICSGIGGVIQTTWSGHSHFATECYSASEVLKYCKYRVIGCSLFIRNFQAIPLAVLKGLEGHQIVPWDCTQRKMWHKAACQQQGKHVLERQLITCHRRTQCTWGYLNQKNSIFRRQTVFFLRFSEGSNAVLCSTREKLAQSTDTRLIYTTGLCHACILFFSITTIKLPGF